MTKLYVYRGVTYTKDGDKNMPVKVDLREKLYRGIAYIRLPEVKHVVCDHVYRGTHYMA